MSSKADFYCGNEWIGSVSKNGDIWSIPYEIIMQISKELYIEEVIKFIESKNGILDEWPWDWEDSRMTNYTYIFDTNNYKVYFCIEGGRLYDPVKIKQGYGLCDSLAEIDQFKFPKMITEETKKFKEIINGSTFTPVIQRLRGLFKL